VTAAETDVLLIADTHLGHGSAGVLIPRIADDLAVADVVLHAGDITDLSVLHALSQASPRAEVRAVAGNLDGRVDLPDRLSLDIAGCTVAMLHDSGPAAGRAARLRRWFPDADLVVFGHSHFPWHEIDVRASDGHVQHHVNPGSPTIRRRAPACSVAHAVLVERVVAEVRHVVLA
jgi:putative phosphoesterase